MTTSHDRSVAAAATVCAANAGSRITSDAAPAAVTPTPATGARDRGAPARLASGAFGVSGRLRCVPPGEVVAPRSPISVDFRGS
ncbi:MAG: hypothetical protein OXH58_08915 [Acidimicrobiaceae bacterium]|nr:hypothetical protein [Acidimicrobiaceae bacterium]MDE0656681.1 hypothetical protein [Acidimicrobiaceae bacterium]